MKRKGNNIIFPLHINLFQRSDSADGKKVVCLQTIPASVADRLQGLTSNTIADCADAVERNIAYLYDLCVMCARIHAY